MRLRVVMSLVALGILATMPSTYAQNLPCSEEPVLAAVDSDGDGVTTAEELREFAPDNERIQEVVAELERESVTGIRYRDCPASTPATVGALLDTPIPPVHAPESSDNDASTILNIPVPVLIGGGILAILIGGGILIRDFAARKQP